MASLSSSSYSLSPSSQSWKYDVFISFRGEDTRKNFVDHLYSTLVQRGIYPYKDDVTLPRGNSIGQSLFKAIEESQIALIVFSENYAESSWCLDELVHIMKCRDEREQLVIPIFYHVNQLDMQRQYWNFAKHYWKNMSKANTWRKALLDAANISGWVIKHMANGHEAQGIEEIVRTVSNNLLSLSSNINEEFIGIRTRLQELSSKLEIELGGVRMIGIWGIGGGGKTTLASSIYHEISRKFDGCCFVDNVRENSSKYGMETLPKKVIIDIMKENVGSVEEGRDMIKSRLRHRKVLIVLDDVDHLDQLNMLAGSHDWFGEGSRIIITTRDIHLLNAHKINATYSISLLNDDEAIKLFCKHAPKQDYIPTQLYATLSNEVVSYARGLPLALKVLGSFLCDKEINEWRSALTRLKDIPEDDIIGKLKTSYNGLKQIEKELFLDIACFHRGKEVEEAMTSLDASGLHPVIGIKVLIQKALITISKNEVNFRHSQGKFDMHDLIQEMGHYIVKGEHPENPEKHSRIWREKEILSICSMNTTMNSDKIEALHLNIGRLEYPQNLPHVVATMKNLRSIYWSFYASELPIDFQSTKLCCLIMQRSMQKQLWEGYKNLPNLKLLDLNDSRELIKTPDLRGLPCLERMILCRCQSLREIHPSTGCHERLAFLNLDWCESLQIFPPIKRMPKLITLILSRCFMLSKFPDIQTKMDSLEDICLSVSGIKVLPSSIVQYCTNLVSLDLRYCQLESIELDFCRFKKLKVLHLPPLSNLVNLDVSRFPHLPRFLTRLSLRSCNLVDGNIPSHIYELSALQVLDLSRNYFSRISFNLVQFPRLKFLNISGCKNLVELPDLPSSISVLEAYGCDSLKIKGDFPTTYKWLWKVTLGYKVCGGEYLLQSMIQGNAAADHFMSFRREYFEISTRSFAYETFILQLPPNWYRDFSGFLICVANDGFMDKKIIIKQEMHTDDQSCHLPDGFNRTEIESMGYIPFSSLMHRPLWNGTISFSIRWRMFKVELVPRRREGGSTERLTDRSEFWDERYKDKKTFTIEHASGTSVEVTWVH